MLKIIFIKKAYKGCAVTIMIKKQALPKMTCNHLNGSSNN